MSSAYITFIPKDDKVKVNNISEARSLEFLGSGETVTDDPANDTIDITINGITKGLAVRTGDGINTVFTIPHGVTGTIPTAGFVQAKSSDALGSFTVSVDTTNITVTYAFPPPSGSSNISLYWIVS